LGIADPTAASKEFNRAPIEEPVQRNNNRQNTPAMGWEVPPTTAQTAQVPMESMPTVDDDDVLSQELLCRYNQGEVAGAGILYVNTKGQVCAVREVAGVSRGLYNLACGKHDGGARVHTMIREFYEVTTLFLSFLFFISLLYPQRKWVYI
jgi:hypothetical protein